MNPQRIQRAVWVLLAAGVVWFWPWFPAGLSDTLACRARYVAQLESVNLSDDRVLAVLRSLQRQESASGTYDAAGIAAMIPPKYRLNTDQVQSVMKAMQDLPESRVLVEQLRPMGQQAWRLFIIFAATIALILLDVMPIFVCALGALATVLLTGVLEPGQAFTGFSNSAIILIVVAFAIAEAVNRSGLGRRIAFHVIRRFGGSTLGLGYSLAMTDWLVAPAFPSNTARSGVLYPITLSVATSAGSSPEQGTREKLGAYLMMNGIAGLSISSATWYTAMAANPVGAEIACSISPEINLGFLRWFLLASVPSIAALLVVPYVLYQLFPPEVKQTPGAPSAAVQELRRMGRMDRDELTTAIVFTGLIISWVLSKTLGVHNTAVAIAGLFILMVTRVISIDELRRSNGPITFVWFAILYTLSVYLDRFGFIEWVGAGVGSAIKGWPWPLAYTVLLIGYVLIHYMFVSQTAHMVAVFPVFLSVGIATGVPAELMAMMLLLATNFFSAITPQASSANAIFVASEYVTPGEVYRCGGIVTLTNLLVYGTVGTAWILFLTAG